MTLLHKYIGLRALGLVTLGVLWCLFGIRALTTPAPAPIPSVVHLLIPAEITGAMWIVSGLAAIVLAPWDRGSDWASALLIVQPGLRLVSYLAGWIVELIPGPPPGDPSGWYFAAIYLIMMLSTRYVSLVPADVRAPLTGRRK